MLGPRQVVIEDAGNPTGSELRQRRDTFFGTHRLGGHHHVHPCILRVQLDLGLWVETLKPFARQTRLPGRQRLQLRGLEQRRVETQLAGIGKA
ncbi:hypothetical protein QMN21_21835, partial [Serratia sp. Se-PFBMAAmG]|nr:hypothetical protein [Serratia sp. Se-PFBMAAmG]